MSYFFLEMELVADNYRELNGPRAFSIAMQMHKIDADANGRKKRELKHISGGWVRTLPVVQPSDLPTSQPGMNMTHSRIRRQLFRESIGGWKKKKKDMQVSIVLDLFP
jgi:hypothetical protein